MTRICAAAVWCALVLGCGCGERSGTAPPAPQGTPSNAGCESRRLSFAPAPRAQYTMVVSEHDTGAAATTSRPSYGTKLTFARARAGWTATEREFAAPRTTLDQVGDLNDAQAEWALDLEGVPTGPGTERGRGRPGILQHLSFFAFRPTGYAFRSTCPGEASSSAWTDAAGRRRTFTFRIDRIDGDDAVLHARGTVATAANSWAIEGEIRVALSDGLTGEARLHETGPGAPAVNDRTRSIRITRQ